MSTVDGQIEEENWRVPDAARVAASQSPCLQQTRHRCRCQCLLRELKALPLPQQSPTQRRSPHRARLGSG